MSLGLVGSQYAGPPTHRYRTGGTLKLLLTSAGVRNPSIRSALVGLLDKPIAESTALCIPTGSYGHPQLGPGERAWRFVSGQDELPMTNLGWKSVGLLELTALPSIDEGLLGPQGQRDGRPAGGWR